MITIPQVDYLSSACKLLSFTTKNSLQDIKISTVYNSQNQLTELVAKDLVNYTAGFNRRFEYENGQLKRIIRNYEDYPDLSPVPIKNQIASEYEYGKYGIEKIHNYESASNGGYETQYFEFKYADGPKPIGMSYFINMSYPEVKFILAFRSTFEYDNNGNLSREIIENVGGLGGSHDTKIKMYFFDDKINTVKNLNYIYFNSEAPALVLSTNNVVKVKSIFPSNEYEQTVSVKYDSNGNALWGPTDFSNVVWGCQ